MQGEIEVAPVHVHDHGGCGGEAPEPGPYSDSDGCEGDTSSDEHATEGCEGDSGGQESCDGGESGGCEGDDSASCDGDQSCEGDAYAQSGAGDRSCRRRARAPIGTLPLVLGALLLTYLKRRRSRLTGI